MASSGDNQGHTCQHGGPGALEVADLQTFVVAAHTNLDKIHKALLFRASHQELLAAEFVVMEELTTKLLSRMDASYTASLMRLFFSVATREVLKGHLETSRQNARLGVYMAMYLRHGPELWEITNKELPEVQQVTLKDLHTALGQIGTDGGLVKFLNVQTPCDCLRKTFFNLSS